MATQAVPARVDDRAPRALTVTELSRLLRQTLRANPLLTRVLVRGEIANVSHAPSGHWFFTLRDAAAAIPCALFRDDAAALGFEPEEGMAVLASGDVELYARRGEVQLVVHSLTPEGVGAFWVSFQQTRRKLEAEGLFDPSKKRPLPSFPARIGVVTSESGAVVHDIVTVLRRRFPLAAIVMSPAVVQGPGAATSVREGLVRVQDRVDVILVGRGGGSMEDLAAFNDEALARAIAACPVPVVSAVGHETDVTIADFVADVRAPTPSAAAELASPDVAELRAQVRSLGDGLVDAMGSVLRERRTVLSAAAHRLSPPRLVRELEAARDRLHRSGRGLLGSAARTIQGSRDALAALAGRLDAISPLATLRRGYAILEREDGALVTRVAQASVGEDLRVRLTDGLLRIHVASKEETP